MPRERTDYIVVHCSATPSSLNVGVKDIRDWHLARGWRDIGYHYVITRDGTCSEGRPREAVGAHVKGYNRVSLGICLVGGVNADGDPDDNFTQRQMDALFGLVHRLKRDHYPEAEVLGHRDLSPDADGDGVVERHEWLKSCPCFSVRDWWEEN